MNQENQNNTVKFNFHLSEDAKEGCEKIMKLRGLPSIQEAIRISISDELHLLEHTKNWRIILENRNNKEETREVLLR